VQVASIAIAKAKRRSGVERSRGGWRPLREAP